MKDGMPTESLWSWASKNPVLSLVINKLLPGAVGLALGLITWRRRSDSKEDSETEEAESTTKPQKSQPATLRPVKNRKNVRPRRS